MFWESTSRLVGDENLLKNTQRDELSMGLLAKVRDNAIMVSLYDPCSIAPVGLLLNHAGALSSPAVANARLTQQGY